MEQLFCEFCGKEFTGRPNRKCCSVSCRRTLENRRRFHDRQFAHVKFLEMNSEWEGHSAEERELYAKQAAELRQKLIEVYGERP